METKLTWEEMKQNYPDEWLLITDVDFDEHGRLISGVVRRHSTDKDEVYKLPRIPSKLTAFRYTGESQFAGLRSHAYKSNLV